MKKPNIKSKATTIINFLMAILIVSLPYISPNPVKADISLSALEQQINILDGEYTTQNGTDSPTDNSFGLVYFDSADYTGDLVYFEAVIRCSSCSGGNSQVTASLYTDDGSEITTINTSSSTYTRIRSTNLSLSADEYTVRFKRDATSGDAYIKAARLVVIQNSASITDTQTQIEMGYAESKTTSTPTSLLAPKYYTYDDSKFSGTKNAYLEATIRLDGNTDTQDLYFDNYDSGGEEWETTPSNMTNGSTANYAFTATDGDIQLLTSNTDDASDHGTITAVEVRAYGYQTDGADGQVFLRPVFGGSDDGDNHTFTPNEGSGSAGYSSYYDITTDTNAPSTWTWSDVDNLDLDVEFNQGASGTNTAAISRVDLRVTYEDNTITGHARLYNITNGQVVTNSVISTSSNSYQRIRSSALTTNWDTVNADEYEVQIYSSNAAYPIYIRNAKIIIDQTEANGINRVETVQQQINTSRSQTNTIYTQESYLNQFDPNNFDGGNSLKAFFEATMTTNAGTGDIRLYNDSDSDPVDTPTDSELTTSSTGSYERNRSSNLANNSDWPTEAKNFDSILRASSGNTVTVSNSWLILQVAAAEPSITFRIQGVSASTLNNGVTTTVASTATTIPFGHIAISTPSYAAHQLNVTTNDASTGYTAYVRLSSQIQGLYPANNIDPFTASSATWSNPQTWTTPTGTTSNVDTGWIGANITDGDVNGWSSSSGRFGPIDTNYVEIMTSSQGEASDEDFITYGFESNIHQPADLYSGTLIYLFLPEY